MLVKWLLVVSLYPCVTFLQSLLLLLFCLFRGFVTARYEKNKSTSIFIIIKMQYTIFIIALRIRSQKQECRKELQKITQGIAFVNVVCDWVALWGQCSRVMDSAIPTMEWEFLSGPVMQESGQVHLMAGGKGCTHY